MSTEIPKGLKCDWCQEPTDHLNETYNPNAMLCDECADQFYNSESPRDHCDLECVMCGRCSEAC